jgi:carbonic anhydrase
MANTNNSGGEGASQSQEANKSFIETAQEAIGDAVDATVQAVKEHPVAAAAVAAGAAAAVGGAVYAATQLGGEKGSESAKGSGSKK